MRPSLRSRSLLRSTTRCLPGLALAALAFSASPSAHAHIQLMNPPSWVVEGNLRAGRACSGIWPGADQSLHESEPLESMFNDASNME